MSGQVNVNTRISSFCDWIVQTASLPYVNCTQYIEIPKLSSSSD